MSEFINNSIVLQNWKLSLLIIVISFAFRYFRSRQKLLHQKSENNNQKHHHITESIIESKEEVEEEEEQGEYDETNQSIWSHLDDKPHIPFVGATITLPRGADQFYEMANNRRSVRKYSQRDVPLNVVEKCILAAGTSPSGAHTEPWTFCLIQDAQIKAQIRDLIEAEEYLNYKQRMSRQWTVDLTPLKTDYVKEYLTDAPYLILVFKQTYGTRGDGKKQQHYYHEISTSIAIGILLSALQSAGLSSLVTTPLNCGPALRTLLHRPVNEKLVVLLPVGYPSDDCIIPNLQRKPLDQIMVKF